jgi:hypothetical protein
VLVFPYFKDDNNTILMDIQFEMYSYSISTIFEEIKRIYLDNKYTILYLSNDEIEKKKEIGAFDHRRVQGTHDMIAAVFRFLTKDGIFEKELFEHDNDQIKSLFNQKVQFQHRQSINLSKPFVLAPDGHLAFV